MCTQQYNDLDMFSSARRNICPAMHVILTQWLRPVKTKRVGILHPRFCFSAENMNRDTSCVVAEIFFFFETLREKRNTQ